MIYLKPLRRPILIGALALGVAVNPLSWGGTGGCVNLATAWAEDSKSKDSKGDKTDSKGDKKDSEKSKDTSDATANFNPTDANLRDDEVSIDRDGSSDQGDSVSQDAFANIIVAYKKATVAAAQADAAVAVARTRLQSAHSRIAASDQAVHDARIKLDTARKTSDQYAIASAQATYDAVLIERQAASADVTTARDQFVAAKKKARNAHRLLDRAIDAAANKDITDRVADSIDALLGIDESP
jgi:hypothetical protein